MKRIEESSGSDTSRCGRRSIIAAAAKKTQAIQERKFREKQEELAAMELKKRKEQRQRDVRNLATKSQQDVQQTVKRQDRFELHSKQKDKNNLSDQKRIGEKPSQLLSNSKKKQEQPTQFFCNEMTEEIDRLKCNKQKKLSQEESTASDIKKDKLFDEDEKELLEKLSTDNCSATQRILQYERNIQREQLLRREELLREKPKPIKNNYRQDQKLKSQSEWELPQLTKEVDEKTQPKDERQPSDLELKKETLIYPKIFDLNGRPDCSTPCASSSESEDERFYRRMVGRYRKTRYSIVNFIKSGAYSTNHDNDDIVDDDDDDPRQQNH